MDSSIKETWHNVSGSQIFLDTYDVRGVATSLHIRPDQKALISAVDRELNQSRVVSPDLDPFLNGMLVPVGGTVKLIDSEADYADLRNSSNSYSESELDDLVRLPPAKFKSKLREITGVTVIRRLKDMLDDDSKNISMAKARAIEARFEELDLTPKQIYTNPDEPLPPVGIS